MNKVHSNIRIFLKTKHNSLKKKTFSRRTCLPGQVWTGPDMLGSALFLYFDIFRIHHFAKQRTNSPSFCLEKIKTVLRKQTTPPSHHIRFSSEKPRGTQTISLVSLCGPWPYCPFSLLRPSDSGRTANPNLLNIQTVLKAG